MCHLILFAAIVAAPNAGQTSDQQITELLKRYQSADARFEKAIKAAKSSSERQAAKKLRPQPLTNSSKLVDWAAARPRHRLSARVLVLVIVHSRESKSVSAAARLLAKDHRDLKPADFVTVVKAMNLPPKQEESFLRTFQAHGTHRGTQAHACFAHGLYKVGSIRYAQMISTPKLAQELEKRWGKERLEYLKTLDIPKANAEAAKLFERILTEFPHVRFQGKRIADIARAPYHAVTKIAIGKKAPDFAGRDVNGKPMKLSDYRGKVVVISFWSTSCKPCMAMLPHEKQLVSRMRRKPFVLLGINSDTDSKNLIAAIEKHKITWPNLWDSKRAISKTWLVNAWPTIIVLDHKGIIRHKHLRGKKLDEAVERLVRRAE